MSQNNGIEGRRLARIMVSDAFLNNIIKGKGNIVHFRIVENHLPEDAIFRWAYIEERCPYIISLVYESPEFDVVELGRLIPILEPPVYEEIDD